MHCVCRKMFCPQKVPHIENMVHGMAADNYQGWGKRNCEDDQRVLMTDAAACWLNPNILNVSMRTTFILYTVEAAYTVQRTGWKDGIKHKRVALLLYTWNKRRTSYWIACLKKQRHASMIAFCLNLYVFLLDNDLNDDLIILYIWCLYLVNQTKRRV